jgi:hypothetical protein
LGVLIVGLLGGGIAAVVVRTVAPEETITHTAEPPPPVTETVLVPAPGQTFVNGTIQTFSAEDAVSEPVKTPFTITAAERGARSNATVEGAIVGDTRKTLYWDAGTPLPISGSGGGLDLGHAHVDANARGVTWALSGDARAFVPGGYKISAPIAIGAGGLAKPSDSGVEFSADTRTVLTATPGVVIHLDSPALQVDGPGRVHMTGTFTVRTQAGMRQATVLDMDTGAFRVTLTPIPGGVSVSAILQGPVT